MMSSSLLVSILRPEEDFCLYMSLKGSLLTSALFDCRASINLLLILKNITHIAKISLILDVIL